MNSVITNILTNPEARSESQIETLGLQLLSEMAIPWATVADPAAAL